jgi:hypothetical protein
MQAVLQQDREVLGQAGPGAMGRIEQGGVEEDRGPERPDHDAPLGEVRGGEGIDDAGPPGALDQWQTTAESCATTRIERLTPVAECWP